MSMQPTYTTTNPFTSQVEATFATMTDAEVQDSLARADAARAAWRATPLAERCAVLVQAAEGLERHRDELARLMAVEMGKPLEQGLGEVDLSADIHRYTAAQAPSALADEVLDVSALGGAALVRHEPLGTIVGVMPWNYPVYQVARFVAPNLAVGNTILLKPSPQCAASARLLDEIYQAAGLPAGVYSTILADVDQVAALVADERVRGISLTGSERAGRSVGETAGRHLTKAVLELGGSDPFVVLPDADLDRVVPDAVLGRFDNTGQACNAAKRFIVVGDAYEPFVQRFAEAVTAMSVGDPLAEGVEIGPLVSVQAAEQVQAIIDDALAHGAVAVAGGARPEQGGAFVAPTVLTGVTRQMRAWSEEIFGPVAVVHHAADVDEAVALANDTPFGLGASVHSRDVEAALAVADRLETGMVFVNEAPGSAAELPFGGVKASGFGRELGTDGLREFANRRMIRIGASD